MTLLTDKGFMSYEEAKAAWDAGTLRVAGFDAATKTIKYERPTAFIDKQLTDDTMYEIANASGTVSLLVTGRHELLLQAAGKTRAIRDAKELNKVKVKDIAHTGRAPGDGHTYRMVNAAAGGVGNGAVPAELLDAMPGLAPAFAASTNKDQLTHSMLRLKGMWLGDGSMSVAPRGHDNQYAISITFCQKNLTGATLTSPTWASSWASHLQQRRRHQAGVRHVLRQGVRGQVHRRWRLARRHAGGRLPRLQGHRAAGRCSRCDCAPGFFSPPKKSSPSRASG